VTKPRKHIGILPGLPFSARRWLLGARVYFTDDGEIRNSSIVRWRYLILHLIDDEAWERYLAGLRTEYAPLIAEKREQWRQRKALAKQRAQEARKRAKKREAADPSRPQPP
jgi:hypothetical protein